MEAGAFGVSTSRALFHKSLNGDFIPTLRTHENELMGLASGLKEAGSGFIEAISDWADAEAPDPHNADIDPIEAFGILKRVSQNSGRPLVYSMVQTNSQSGICEQVLEMNRKAYEDEGVNIRSVFPPRAVGFLLGLQANQTPFSGCPTFKPLNDLPLAEKVAKLRDPAVREQILSEDPVKESTFPLIHLLSYAYMFPFRNKDYQPQQNESAMAVADREGRSAPEVVYDWLVENDGKNFIYIPVAHYTDFTFGSSEKLLGEKMAIMGLGDGGANVGFILDAGFPTWLLTHWGKVEAKFAMPELVCRLTSDTADAAGLKADLNVIDWAALDFDAVIVLHDLPAGGKRLMQGASGYDYTIVSGEVTHQSGKPTGKLPGKLIRGQRGTPASSMAVAAE